MSHFSRIEDVKGSKKGPHDYGDNEVGLGCVTL